MAQARPRVGITRCSRLGDYVESIKKAGGSPIVLDYDADPGRVIDAIDGLVLTGGVDVDPSRYGESPHPATEIDDARDAFEFGIAERALARDLPVLAICRGMQLLNVAAGGDLVQDIPSQFSTPLDHTVDSSPDAVAHKVRIERGSLLARIVTNPAHLETCGVNSRHHQSVRRVAPGFSVSATSPDGVIEGIESRDASFCVGVQWHPENFHRTGEFDSLFESFVDACKRDRD
ncbi:MAG: gamma-glutamyl-gamma-aminobutyrate hydrolase family protein [Acidobacteria bacterium]|nr:gamma-glutamyl-gamma-aminobutyrate hydrolase family protein [Acidobacteriota bacterium]MBI3262023.1 gamma-glutamyl-gamma-aminobutyrate hydrolase family protein [Acidobacteriota bacterium]